MQKTRRKTVLGMIGPFIAHETVHQCRVCSRTGGSDSLLRLVSSRCNVAYDVLVHVGKALFQRYRTTEEVRTELAVRNVRLCASEIAYLGRKFVTYLAIGHRRATPRIREAMKLSGGYVLHLDATHDGDAPALMTGIDSLSRIVLANVKVPSEHAGHIVPFLRRLKTDYGTPCACVHDMGLGIISAVAEVFPGVRDFICHFHFLRDIGKDVLEPAYNELRKRLRSHSTSARLHALARETRQQHLDKSNGTAPTPLAKAILAGEPLEDSSLLPLASTYVLALWVLQGKHSGDGYGFPFDRPLLSFAQRLLDLDRRLPEFMDILPNNHQHDHQTLCKLAREIRGAA
ncbi:MAG: transposase, partial [Syntrophales bacterium]